MTREEHRWYVESSLDFGCSIYPIHTPFKFYIHQDKIRAVLFGEFYCLFASRYRANELIPDLLNDFLEAQGNEGVVFHDEDARRLWRSHFVPRLNVAVLWQGCPMQPRTSSMFKTRPHARRSSTCAC